MSTFGQPAKWFIDLFRSNDGTVPVNADTLVESAAIYYAINRIAGDVGKMPIEPRRSTADFRGSNPARTHPTYRLLRSEPNDWQTAVVFKEYIQSQALLHGNGRAAIVRRAGRPVELIPMDSAVTASIVVEGRKYHVTKPGEDDPVRFRELFFRVLDQPGLLDDFLVLGDADVWHIWGYSKNGFEGVALYDIGSKFGSLELGAQEFARTGMHNGFAGQIMLEAPPNMFRTQDEAQKFLNFFRKQHERKGGNRAVGMLREGMKAQMMQSSNVEAEFLAQRRFSRQEVMLWFGLQHIPGDDSATSYNSLEQQQLDYLASALDRWLCRWEQESERKFLTQSEKNGGRVYFKFNRGTWLRTDMQTTQSVLSGFVGSEIITRNEAREKLDMNPIDGGDDLLNPNLPDRSRESAGEAAAESDPASGDQEMRSNILRERLECLVELEVDRIRDAARNPDKFLDFVDSFYSKWGITLLGSSIDAVIVSKMIAGHKSDLLDLTSHVRTADELVSGFDMVASAWRNDVEKMQFV